MSITLLGYIAYFFGLLVVTLFVLEVREIRRHNLRRGKRPACRRKDVVAETPEETMDRLEREAEGDFGNVAVCPMCNSVSKITMPPDSPRIFVNCTFQIVCDACRTIS